MSDDHAVRQKEQGEPGGRPRGALRSGIRAPMLTVALLTSLCVTIAVAAARPFPLPPTAPVATIDVPDDWGPAATSDGVDGAANRGAVRLSAQFIRAPNADMGLSAAMTGLRARGLLAPGLRQRRASSQRAGEFDALRIDFSEDGTDEPAGTLMLVGLPAKAGFVAVSWWGDDDAQESVGTDLLAIVESVRLAK